MSLPAATFDNCAAWATRDHKFASVKSNSPKAARSAQQCGGARSSRPDFGLAFGGTLAKGRSYPGTKTDQDARHPTRAGSVEVWKRKSDPGSVGYQRIGTSNSFGICFESGPASTRYSRSVSEQREVDDVEPAQDPVDDRPQDRAVSRVRIVIATAKLAPYRSHGQPLILLSQGLLHLGFEQRLARRDAGL
jgi:hypothetical protein